MRYTYGNGMECEKGGGGSFPKCKGRGRPGWSLGKHTKFPLQVLQQSLAWLSTKNGASANGSHGPLSCSPVGTLGGWGPPQCHPQSLAAQPFCSPGDSSSTHRTSYLQDQAGKSKSDSQPERDVSACQQQDHRPAGQTGPGRAPLHQHHAEKKGLHREGRG